MITEFISGFISYSLGCFIAHKIVNRSLNIRYCARLDCIHARHYPGYRGKPMGR